MLLLMRRDIVFSLMTFVVGPAGDSMSPVKQRHRTRGENLEDATGQVFCHPRRAAPRAAPSAPFMTVAKSPPNREEEIRQAYLRVSHAFEGGREHRAELYADYLEFFSDDDVVLDFGCGDGTWLELLSDRGIDAVGSTTTHRRSLNAAIAVSGWCIQTT